MCRPHQGRQHDATAERGRLEDPRNSILPYMDVHKLDSTPSTLQQRGGGSKTYRGRGPQPRAAASAVRWEPATEKNPSVRCVLGGGSPGMVGHSAPRETKRGQGRRGKGPLRCGEGPLKPQNGPPPTPPKAICQVAVLGLARSHQEHTSVTRDTRVGTSVSPRTFTLAN